MIVFDARIPARPAAVHSAAALPAVTHGAGQGEDAVPRGRPDTSGRGDVRGSIWPRAAKDAVVIARAYGATATTAFASGHGPDGLADEERQSAACPVIGEEASHDK